MEAYDASSNSCLAAAFRDVDSDPVRRALASALICYARETCQVLAEGIETAGELETLKMLGFQKDQGYLLGRPLPYSSALELIGSTRVRDLPAAA